MLLDGDGRKHRDLQEATEVLEKLSAKALSGEVDTVLRGVCAVLGTILAALQSPPEPPNGVGALEGAFIRDGTAAHSANVSGPSFLLPEEGAEAGVAKLRAGRGCV